MAADESFQVSQIMRLQDLVSGPLRRIRAGMAATEASSASLSGRLFGVARAMAPLAIAGSAVLAALTGIAASTIPTQKALGELASVGIEDMEALEAAAVSFSNQFSGTTKPEFLSAAYDIKSGIASLSDTGVAEFTKLSALTGKATKSTTGEMTSLFATGYGIYKNFYRQLSDFQFGEIFSAGIAASVQQFKTTGSGMAQAISSLGAAATTSLVPMQEQFAVLGMLQATMSGSEAGTKYKSLVQGIARAAKKLGLPFLDANNRIKSLPEILDILKSRFGETLDAAEKLQLKKAFRRDEAIATIDLLFNKVGDLRSNIQNLNTTMQQGQGFTLKMARTMNRDLGARIDIARQRLRNLTEMLGGMFAPILSRVADKISGIAVSLMECIKRKSELARTVLLLIGGLSALVVGITALSAAGAGLSFVMGWIGLKLAVVSWPVWALIGTAGLLYLAWRTNFGGIADTLSSFYQKTSLVIRGVITLFQNLSGTKSFLEGDLAKEIKAEGLLGLVTTVFRVLIRVREFLGGIWDAFSSTFGPVFTVIGEVFVSLGSALGSLLRLLGLITGGLFGMSTALDADSWRMFGLVLGTLVSSVFKPLAWSIRIVGTVLSWVLDLIGGVGEKIVSVFSGGVVSAVSGLVNTVKGAFSGIRDLLPFSDAREGPLSDLTRSGASFMETLGQGMTAGSPVLKKALAGALAGATLSSSLAVSPPAIESKPAAVTGKTISINIEDITLPSVQNGRDFMAELTRLVEQYDV